MYKDIRNYFKQSLHPTGVASQGFIMGQIKVCVFVCVCVCGEGGGCFSGGWHKYQLVAPSSEELRVWKENA